MPTKTYATQESMTPGIRKSLKTGVGLAPSAALLAAPLAVPLAVPLAAPWMTIDKREP